jgi:gas vesicle protein
LRSIGAIAGAVGGLLLAPKSGKETRADLSKLAAEISKKLATESRETNKRIKEVFGQVSKEAEIKYQEIKSRVAVELAKIKAAGEKVDKEKYVKLVENIVAEFKSELTVSKANTTKLMDYLKLDWEKLSKKPVAKKIGSKKLAAKPLAKKTAQKK